MGEDSRTRAARGWASATRSDLPSRGEGWTPPRQRAGAPGLPGAPAGMTAPCSRRSGVATSTRKDVAAWGRGDGASSCSSRCSPSGRAGARRSGGEVRRTCRRSRAFGVVGSGPIAWANVAVRSAPRRDARGRHDARAVPARLPPAHGHGARRAPGCRRAPNVVSVSVAGRPNGRTGWIPAAAASVAPVDRWLVVYRGSRKFELYVNGRLRRTGPDRGRRTRDGDADSASSTCSRRFVPSKYPILGAFAFETSGYSKLSDWPGGGVVGVHGTNTPWLIGQAVSHGCVRLRNSDVLALRKLVRVGTPGEDRRRVARGTGAEGACPLWTLGVARRHRTA